MPIEMGISVISTKSDSIPSFNTNFFWRVALHIVQPISVFEPINDFTPRFISTIA